MISASKEEVYLYTQYDKGEVQLSLCFVLMSTAPWRRISGVEI